MSCGCQLTSSTPQAGIRHHIVQAGSSHLSSRHVQLTLKLPTFGTRPVHQTLPRRSAAICCCGSGWRLGALADAPKQRVFEQADGTVIEHSGRNQRTYRLDGVTETKPASRSVDDASRQQGGFQDQAAYSLKEFVLPKGYPDSVTSDYLPYQLWAVPSHVFGWLSVSLATSSLLKALGASPGAAGVAASAAAIKWITKDGIGAAGKLLIGGRFGGIFDEDPRRWRMLAEAFATVGQGFEIATGFFPGSFLLLAGAGNLTKAVGKGLGKPSFRIIQNHFALRNNLGDISAKEEVWEVTAQMIGLALSVGALRSIETSHLPVLVLPAWAASQAAHIAFRYKSLGSLRFNFLNHRRACTAALAHVNGQPVEGMDEVNSEEAYVVPPRLSNPSLNFGACIQDAGPLFPGQYGARQSSHTGSNPSSSGQHAALASLAKLYADQQYMLVWKGGKGTVLLRQGVQQPEVLQAVLQAAQLHADGVQDAEMPELEHSLQSAQKQWPDFVSALELAGWDLSLTNIRSGDTRLQW